MNGIFLSKWLKSIGRSRMTGYRWVAAGKITVVSVYGRLFITEDEIARFFREGKVVSE